MTERETASSSVAELVKGLTDSVFVVHEDRRIQDFNRPFTKLHQIDRSKLREVRGTFCRELVDLEICERECIVKKVFESGATTRFDEVAGKTLSGEDLNLIVTAVPIRDAAGKVTSVIEIHRDVTDEARIHEKYKVLLDKEKRAKEELERLVDERTKELQRAYSDLKKAEGQLVHSEKMSSLGQMVAGIAHELNNPINFIYGNVESLDEYLSSLSAIISGLQRISARDEAHRKEVAEILSTHDLDYILEDFPQLIKSIRSGSERAAEIIRGLRTFSRLDEAQFKESNLHEGIDMTLTLLRNQYKERIEIRKEYGDLPPVKCHFNEVNQVFMNILQNSIHAITGSGTIVIRTRMEGERVCVEFEDTGSGISDENLKRIFDPFFTTKDVGKGTGLGLSISYGIIEKHGGSIDVESKLGHGTKFRIWLPCVPPLPAS